MNRKETLHSELAESRETLLTAIDTLAADEWDRPTSNQPGRQEKSSFT